MPSRAARSVRSCSAWLVLLGVLGGYFVVLLALGGHPGWRRLGVPPLVPGFADLRSITSGWDCARQHLGAWPVNPCDPLGGRPENYPRLWIAASFLGLGQDDTYVLGTILAVVFFVAAIAVLPRRAPVGAALIYGAALCSPAVMLGVERGNVDLLLFAMVAAAGLALRRPGSGAPVASALLLSGAVLKLFPIFAVGMLARLPRRAAVICVASVAGIFALYAAATFEDIRTIQRVLPQQDEYSYGLAVFGDWLGRLVAHGRRPSDVVLVVLALGAAAAMRRPLRRSLDASMTGYSRELDLFWAGGGIYVATFVLGRSFDYRLAFLLLTIPWLARLRSVPGVLPTATLGAVLLVLWLPSPWANVPLLGTAIDRWNALTAVRGDPLPIASPAQLAAFVGLACLLMATLPLPDLRRSRTRYQAVTSDADEPTPSAPPRASFVRLG